MGNFTATTILKNLGLEEKNAGTSIGNQWHNSSEWIASYSPIDSAHLGDVSVLRKNNTTPLYLLRRALLKIGVIFLLLNAVNTLDNLEMNFAIKKKCSVHLFH